MKYNISINQLALITVAPSLDIIDATVLDWALSFIASGNTDKLTTNNQTYHWLSYDACLSDLPLLHVSSKDSIRRRFKNLVDTNLLDAHPDNMAQRRTYFKAGNLAASIYFDPAKIPLALQICKGGPSKNARGVLANLQGDNSIIDYNNKDNLSLSFHSRDFDFSLNAD